VIHSDPVYMPRKRRMWSAVNTEINDVQCESSMWLGAMHRTPDGSTVDLFKSWATVRDRQPSELIHERNFRHLLPTPDMLAAQRVLAERQGAENIWFAGAYMGPYVNQENALQSAIGIAQSITPNSAHLTALLAGLATETRHPELEQFEVTQPESTPLRSPAPLEAN
jgi:predicted NAD/FAD-binding protein